MTQSIDHLSLYRLPWNYSDNGISWLEPTTKCNLRCEGCYRDLENPYLLNPRVRKAANGR
jgi:MoaA/NifB/PqqE/SkfB family radical SAM enzyme